MGPQLQAQQYGMAFEKGSELREKVNASLAKLKANGTYKAIYAKWFGEEPRSSDPTLTSRVVAQVGHRAGRRCCLPAIARAGDPSSPGTGSSSSR